uniref:hypothetical protein n=1 Tax=Alistipes sp. TaxID=1872444 RepID=UPI004056D689
MRQFYGLLLLLFFINIESLQAQDIITFCDGSKVEAKIVEVTQTEIRYKKFRNIDGPLYTISQGKVDNIMYKNGDVEQYGQKDIEQTYHQTITQQIVKPIELKVIPDNNNSKYINDYSRVTGTEKTKPQKVSRAYVNTIKFGLTKSSIVSTSEVEVHFKPYTKGQYDLIVKNKSNALVYVDLGNSFRVDSKGNTRCYYDGTNTMVSSSNSVGGGLSLGAISNVLGITGPLGTIANGLMVGGGRSQQVSTSYAAQRVISIAPNGNGFVSQYRYDQAWISKGEYFGSSYEDDVYGLPEGCKGEMRYFNENNSPHKIDYYITYSTDPNFNTYQVMKFTLYISQVYGEGMCNGLFDTNYNDFVVGGYHTYTHSFWCGVEAGEYYTE